MYLAMSEKSVPRKHCTNLYCKTQVINSNTSKEEGMKNEFSDYPLILHTYVIQFAIIPLYSQVCVCKPLLGAWNEVTHTYCR